MGTNTNNSLRRNSNFSPSSSYQSLDYISVEIIEWQYSNSILYRILLEEEILTVKFNPYCETEVCFGGKDSLKIYSFESGNLVVKEDLFDFG